jgi:hypothetical protein
MTKLTPETFTEYVNEHNPDADVHLVRLMEILFYTKPYVEDVDFEAVALKVPSKFPITLQNFEYVIFVLYMIALTKEEEKVDFDFNAVARQPNTLPEKARLMYETFMAHYYNVLEEDRKAKKAAEQARNNHYRGLGTPEKPKTPSPAVVAAKNATEAAFQAARQNTNAVVSIEHYIRPLRYIYNPLVLDSYRFEYMIGAVGAISRFGIDMWQTSYENISYMLD